MAKKLTPEDFRKLEEQKERQDRANNFKKAVEYQEKKFNCVIIPVHTFVGGNMQSGWLGEALPVKEKK
ncbi:hypothetical protein LCGC14_1125830 [marine sediment metagenome]|uniref:Uncharacterized protein n=2 Tax=root TaxID=1 RepID=A0A831QMI6_9FLAO|nr:hypothetical protein [Pricia antarctica]